MFTPQRRNWSPWSPSPPAKSIDREKALSSPEIGGNDLSPVQGLIERPPITPLQAIAGVAGRSEPELWRKFREVGGLDEDSPEKKDRAALIAHISNLETELHDYQYNMGLLLMERKEWDLKNEKLKAAKREADEDWRRELAARGSIISEAGKREEGLKKALAIEKQCVCDLEKTLKEMRAEAAELKVSADNKLTQARDMIAGTAEKALLAESKLYSAEALQAEANRKHAEADRKLFEVQAREDALRRERHDFKSECENHQVELSRQRQNLYELDKKVQNGQERLLDGQRILNQREEYANQRDKALKLMEEGFQDTNRQLEKKCTVLQQSEVDLNAKLAALEAREENAVEQEISAGRKEQELLLFQENLASKERTLKQREQSLREKDVFAAKERDRLEALERTLKLKEESLLEQKSELIELQKTIDHEKAEHDGRKVECEVSLAELGRKHSSLLEEREEIDSRRFASVERETEMGRRDEKLTRKEQQLEKKAEKLKEKEKDLDAKVKAVKEKDQGFKNEQKRIEEERKLLEEQKEALKLAKEEIEQHRKEILEERSQIQEERVKLIVNEQEREDLVKLQVCLKEEIDYCRAHTKAVSIDADELKKEKEKFEKEWDILDEKREQVRKKLEQIEEERKRVDKWLKDEEERLKQAKLSLREQVHRDTAALQLEKEAFVNSMHHERSEWFTKMDKESKDLVRDIDVRRRELERNMDKRREEIEKQYKDRESRLRREMETEKERMTALRALAEKELGKVHQEKQKLERERKEITKHRQELERDWIEIKKDIGELQVQREKLKQQREGLQKERADMFQEAEKLNKLREELGIVEDSLKSDQDVFIRNEAEVLSPKELLETQPFPKGDTLVLATATKSTTETTPGKSSGTPSRLSWLQKCASVLFHTPDRKLGTVHSKGSIDGGRNVNQRNIEKLETEPQALSFDMDENQLDISLLEKEEQAVEQLSRSTGSLSPDHPSGLEDEQQKGQSWKGKGLMEDANMRLNTHVEWEGPNRNAEEEKVVSASHLEDKDGDSAALLNTEQQGTNKLRKQGKKRRHQQHVKEALSREEVEEVDTESEIISEGRRKRRQREVGSSLNSDFGKETLGAKRYNLRHSTIATKVGPQAASTDFKKRSTSDKDKEQEAPEVLQEVSSPERRNAVPIVTQTERPSRNKPVLGSGEVNIQPDWQQEERLDLVDSPVAIELSLSDGNEIQVRHDKEGVVSVDKQAEMDGEYEASEGEDKDEREEEESQIMDMEHRHEEQGEEEDGEENEDLHSTLKEKLWDFFTT